MLCMCFRVSVIGLNPDTRYKLVVYSENGVSAQKGEASSAYVVVQTEAASEYTTTTVW